MKIVTAEYKDVHKLNEWIPTVQTMNIDYIIYRKVDTLKIGEEVHVSKNTIEIPNFGRCDYAFLYHIINNYDDLDDVTVFVKSNWKDNGIDLYGHLQKCSDYDYMQSGTLRKYQHWNDKNLVYPRDEELHKCTHPFAQTCFDWYNEIYPNVEPPDVVHGYGHGPCFSVSRRLIQRHPKSIYIHLLNKFYPDSNSWNTYIASKFCSTLDDQKNDVGKHYHDHFQRFYTVLFTHNTS